ncbi:MAG: carotenoid biosynthesis protein [Deltaproteobacteria bacterium]|nr:carotenoid biosynthesis protein [Deltaproteobacteria bacterium]
MDLLQLTWGTLILRPYVFIFLACYLALAILHLGLGRALAFLVLGYLVAWTVEFSSIHTGFPFGLYIYIPATEDRELWIAGVPFMDSLSYVFLAYAGFTMALPALGRSGQGGRFHPEDEKSLWNSWRVAVLGAVLTMTLDIVIDPVALRGYRWFLGQIYGYPEYGVYFGVPLTNFAGWFLVAFVLLILLQVLNTRLPASGWWTRGRRRFAGQAFLGPALYLGILAFNLFMTFWIGEYTLGWVGVFIYAPFLTWLALKTLP